MSLGPWFVNFCQGPRDGAFGNGIMYNVLTMNAKPTHTKGQSMYNVGRQNLLHAYAACEDPDCEIHHPEVIEEYASRATAKAWWAAGMHEFQEAIYQRLRDNDDRTNPAWDHVENAMAELTAAHNLREFVETEV